MSYIYIKWLYFESIISQYFHVKLKTPILKQKCKIDYFVNFTNDAFYYFILRKNFKSSLIIELYWENKIDYAFKNDEESYEKFSLFTLFRKFFSKKIRSIFS